MNSHTISKMPNGDTVNVMTIPGAPPVVFLNGVIQHPGSYSVSNGTVFFEPPPLHTKWYPWFAWHPVRLHGKWTWLKTIYRQHLLSPGGGIYRYGDDFDVLKDSR